MVSGGDIEKQFAHVKELLGKEIKIEQIFETGATVDVAAITKVIENDGMGAVAYNIGTGNGTSVLEVVAAMEKASGNKVNYKILFRKYITIYYTVMQINKENLAKK